MKRKQTVGVESTPLHHKTRNASNGGTSVLGKRKQQSRNNKQNIIQLAESAGLTKFSYPSKEYIPCKDHSNTKSKSSLKDVSPIQNMITTQNSCESNKRYEKEQELFDRRLSLKNTTNYSQQLEYQKSQRLSMVPLRRQSNVQSTISPQCFIEDRESLSSIYQQSLLSSESKARHQIKKQAIITNLVNKLQHEQDLRSIIQSKLKNSSTLSFAKERRNQSYLTDYTEENSSIMASKLKQCQNEIKYFKSVIKEMSERIFDLAEEKDFSKKKSRAEQSEPENNRLEDNANLIALLKNIGTKCENCEKRAANTKQIGTQTSDNSETNFQRSKVNESFDFFDNIQKTLKILDNRKY